MTLLSLEQFQPDNLTVNHGDVHHQFEAADCYAMWSAYAAGRPLLLRGNPGTGKSQMAQAIARHLNWAFVSEVVRGSTELSDLHWHFDAIARLGEAQVLGLLPKVAQSTRRVRAVEQLDPKHFLAPGAFWWAYDWPSAQRQQALARHQAHCGPSAEQATQANNGVVLLIDEIDKADPDLPNGLLETLGQYQFTVPYLKQTLTANPHKLLVIITTNQERDLPKAFMRRCFVHTLHMDENPESRAQWLIKRGKLHFAETIHDEVYRIAAELLWQDRDQQHNQPYLPGLAEYLDLLRALSGMQLDQQQQRIKDIAQYALKK